MWLTSGPLRCARNGRGDGDDGKHGDDHGGKAGEDCEKRRTFEGHEGMGKKAEEEAGVEREVRGVVKVRVKALGGLTA